MAKSKKRSLRKAAAPTVAEDIGAFLQSVDAGSTMDEMEDAIDDLIIRINAQTQRIKDMM